METYCDILNDKAAKGYTSNQLAITAAGCDILRRYPHIQTSVTNLDSPEITVKPAFRLSTFVINAMFPQVPFESKKEMWQKEVGSNGKFIYDHDHRKIK